MDRLITFGTGFWCHFIMKEQVLKCSRLRLGFDSSQADSESTVHMYADDIHMYVKLMTVSLYLIGN